MGERLGVTRVIEGSVRREGSRVRIAVRLADARSGYQLWPKAFDREVAGMLPSSGPRGYSEPSSVFAGVGADAAHVVEHIARQ